MIVSVGLAQNLAALRALATEGIQRGHMGLHARQVAVAAGASPELIEQAGRPAGARKSGAHRPRPGNSERMAEHTLMIRERTEE